MDDGTEDSAVQDFLQILEEHRKNCERQGKYVEAEIAKNRLEELKLHEHNVRVQKQFRCNEHEPPIISSDNGIVTGLCCGVSCLGVLCMLACASLC